MDIQDIQKHFENRCIAIQQSLDGEDLQECLSQLARLYLHDKTLSIFQVYVSFVKTGVIKTK